MGTRKILSMVVNRVPPAKVQANGGQNKSFANNKGLKPAMVVSVVEVM